MRSEKVKDMIIHDVLLMINKDSFNKKSILESLSDFAKYYRIPIKSKGNNSDLMTNLLAFIKNERGYIETIPNLYRSIEKF